MKAENATRLVLWNFARLLRTAPRGPMLPQVEDGSDAPPEGFVEKISDEGGDVFMAPVLEALRATLRHKRGLASDASPNAPQRATSASSTEPQP